ncbi:MAG: hypothetical protein MUO58_05320 [Anaerolineales bacterium]|nr:hypothetical protein [Anaerolineales bacterium]
MRSGFFSTPSAPRRSSTVSTDIAKVLDALKLQDSRAHEHLHGACPANAIPACSDAGIKRVSPRDSAATKAYLRFDFQPPHMGYAESQDHLAIELRRSAGFALEPPLTNYSLKRTADATQRLSALSPPATG